MENCVSIHDLVKLVDAEDLTNEKIRTFDLPLENNIVTSKLESRNLFAAIFDANPEMIFTQTTYRNSRL